MVRLELIQKIYHDMYIQKIKTLDETQWQHRILPRRQIIGAKADESSGSITLRLQRLDQPDNKQRECTSDQETLHVNAIVVATGYTRNAHERMLQKVQHLRPSDQTEWCVGRNYRLEMDSSKVSNEAGLWLQGCNESTHGLSDTLLSVLATRSGEIVTSILGDQLRGKSVKHPIHRAML